MIDICHISDLHFGKLFCVKKKYNEYLYNPINGLIDFLESREESMKPDFLIISGDLTSMASSEEFDDFLNLIQLFEKGNCLKKSEKYPPKMRILIVPGNHDLKWSRSGNDKLNTFKNKVVKGGLNTPFGNKAFKYCYTIENDGLANSIFYYPEYNILFHLIISGFFSGSLTEDEKILLKKISIGNFNRNSDIIDLFNQVIKSDNPYFPVSYINEIKMNYNNNVDKYDNVNKVAITHHNLDLFGDVTNIPVNSNILKNSLDKLNYSILLYGHTHCSTHELPFNKDRILSVPCDSIGAPSITGQGFNFIHIDENNNKSLEFFKFDENSFVINRPKELYFDISEVQNETIDRIQKYLENEIEKNKDSINNFIEMKCNVGNNDEDIDKYLLERIEEDSIIVVLGNSGSGKTTLCKYLFNEFSKRFLLKELNYLPFLILLKDYTKIHSGEEFINDFILRLEITNEDFLSIRDDIEILCIMDGLDEAPKEIAINIYKALDQVRILGKQVSKVILTSRTQFFKNILEEEEIMLVLDENDFHTSIIHINEFRIDDIQKYIKNTCGEKSEVIYEYISNTYDLIGLSKSPLLLFMIVNTITMNNFDSNKPFLEKDKPITLVDNKASLYSQYVNSWFRKEKQRFLRRQNSSVFPDEEINNLLESIAFNLYFENKYEMSYSELQTFINQQFSYQNPFIFEYFENIIRVNSFFFRSGDTYSFSHNSFMEFFVAKRIKKMFINKDFEELRDKQYNFEVLEFLKYMITPSIKTIFEYIIYEEKNPDIMLMVTELIGTARLNNCIEILYYIINNEQNNLIKTEAFISLGYLGYKEYLHQYVENMNADKSLDDENHQYVMKYYGNEKKARYFLHSRLEDPYYENVRAFHIHTLAKIGNEESVKLLGRFLTHEDPFVKNYAENVIERIKNRLFNEGKNI
ncbi:MAG: metallophosphoesterase [Candidatus Omnitrophica bacterium]|nr:metallophosphoesterase [Candidatus Omnitrophota bacterium]